MELRELRTILKDMLNRLLHIDYIVDEGTTEDGWTYIKYASGWAEAWYRGNIGQVTLSTQLGTDIVSNSIFIDFPFSFVEIPYCILNYEGNSSGYTNVQYSNAGATTVSKSYGIRLVRMGNASIALQNNIVSCYVKGRWKSMGGGYYLASLLSRIRDWGDGEHESTKYMMDFISKYGVKDKSVIDIGTGILSVLCGKLGAAHILALDIDTHSLEWARKNFKRNDVDVEVEVNNLTDYIDDKADVILANLPGTIQVENVKTVAKNLNDDGLLIMSWWNKLKFEDYVRGFEVIEHIAGKDYDVYVLKKATE